MAGIIPIKQISNVAEIAGKYLSKPTTSLSYLMKNREGFKRALERIADGNPTKIILGPTGSTVTPMQAALAELVPSKLVVVGRKGYAPYIQYNGKLNRIGGFVYSSGTPNISSNYVYISNPLLREKLPNFNRAEQDLIIEQIEKINSVLKKHYSKQFDTGFINQMNGRYKSMPEEQRLAIIRKLLGTNGLNYNKRAGMEINPKWSQQDYDILRDAYDELSVIIPLETKRITGGLNNVAFPYKGSIFLDGGGKSYTDVVRSIPNIGGKKNLTYLPNNLKLNEYEEYLYNLINSGKDSNLQGIQNLIITNIKDPTLGVTYGSMPKTIVQAKKGGKLKNNRWKPKQ